MSIPRRAAALAASLTLACAPAEGVRIDTLGSATTTVRAGGQVERRTPPPAPDTVPSVVAARDADQAFLRLSSDHHEALVLLATPAATRGSLPSVRSDAERLLTQQRTERDAMVAQLRTYYGETHTPTVAAEYRALADSLQGDSGAEYDRAFAAAVARHQEEAVAIVDDYLPRLTRPAVRQMAARMRAEQLREMRSHQRP